MQVKTFNRLVIISMAVAIVVPLSVWFIDSLSTQTGWFAHILGSLALMAIPILWVIGNIATGITALLNRPLHSKLFWLQCAVTALIFVGLLVWAVGEQTKSHQENLRNSVKQAIVARDISKYKQALQACGDACKRYDIDDSVTKNANQYDEYSYKEWLANAVAAQAIDIVDDLLIDRNRPDIPLTHSDAPYLSLSYSCRGYYVGDANVFQIAVFQKTPDMLKRLIASATNDEKSTALWYAAQANRIDYVQLLLAAGANRDIKDAYGLQGVEQAGYSLVDAAVQGFAIETLEWLLQNGFLANGQLGKTTFGKDETLRLKHTPLHSVIYMAHQEQEQFNSLERSIKMWQILIKAGADDTIAQVQSEDNPQTPMQLLLASNVYDNSAQIVKAFVANNISTQGLSAQQQAKLQTFLSTKSDKDNSYAGQSQPEYCAENWLRKQYQAAY
jgi:Ankyrin repeats (3 copies)